MAAEQGIREYLSRVEAAATEAEIVRLYAGFAGVTVQAAAAEIAAGLARRACGRTLMHGSRRRLSALTVCLSKLERLRTGGGRAAVHGLSDRERLCLSLLAAGLRVEAIAATAGISAATVRFHIGRARRKLHARTREEAVAILAAHNGGPSPEVARGAVRP